MNITVLDVRPHAFHSAPIFLKEDDFEEIQTCPACAAEKDLRVLASTQGKLACSLEVSCCKSCSHIYLSRRPSEAWVQHYYSHTWDTGRSSQAPVQWWEATNNLLRRNRITRRVGRAARIIREDLPRVVYPGTARFMHMLGGVGDTDGYEFPRGRRLLEIGTGYGLTLSFLRDIGFETFGTEANAHRASECRKKGLKVLQTEIDNLDPLQPFAPFDFVYSAHVFEHLTDLSRMMHSVDALVEEGALLYIEVPHTPIAEDILLRSHIPVHYHLFSASSLCGLMRRFGFEPVRILADVSLHILAQKGGPHSAIGDVTIPSAPECIVHGLQHLVTERDPILAHYRQFEMELRRVSDGSVIYTRPFPYGSSKAAASLTNEFVLQSESSENHGLWPLRFLHATNQAPIWVKQQ